MDILYSYFLAKTNFTQTTLEKCKKALKKQDRATCFDLSLVTSSYKPERNCSSLLYSSLFEKKNIIYLLCVALIRHANVPLLVSKVSQGSLEDQTCSETATVKHEFHEASKNTHASENICTAD